MGDNKGSEGTGKKSEQVFEPLSAIGVFLAVFGAVILYATTVPEEFWDKLINLSAGIVLLAIGLFCFFLGWSRSRKARSKTNDDQPG
jgi:hypothetical protein